MSRLRAVSKQQEVAMWQRFQTLVAPELFSVSGLDWPQVNRLLMNYINKNAAESPWLNQLALLLGASTCYARLSEKTILSRLNSLHCRWTTIFQAYGLMTFEEWKPEEHLVRYLRDQTITETFSTRQHFLNLYACSTQAVQAYLHSLPEDEREILQPWGLPPLPAGVRRQIDRGPELLEGQVQRRKAESDAVPPHFARIRGEAHVRWNELFRLRQQFRHSIALVQAGEEKIPVDFSYEEPRRELRLHWTLWDRPHFVMAHAEGSSGYHRSTIGLAKEQIESGKDEEQTYFLEFRGAESLKEEGSARDPDLLLWFGDLLRYNLLSNGAIRGTPEEVQRKQAYLRSWGYGDEHHEHMQPFHANHLGLLTTQTQARDGMPTFLSRAQRRTSGHLVFVESLFAAATFGLAALDFFTTTGARIAELQQISLQSECLYTLKTGDTQRLLVRLIPKGSDEPAEYMVGPETRKNFERVATLLQDHYALQPGETLPKILCHPDHTHYRDLPDERPYLFQYHRQCLSQRAITACLRFLCHGMVFTSAEGKVIVLKAHLLRHVFATHLRHVEQVPLDIVAKILHQKNVRVTAYYAASPWQQVVERMDSFLDRFATHLGNIEETFLRAPAELRQQFEEAQKTVGTLAKVVGGECTCHAQCPISFACAGCVYKVPNPARRGEVVEQKQWALVRLEQVRRRGMGPETVKMEALVHRCDTELEEMDLIEEYRRNEAYQPQFIIERTES